ncbi:hypothetical protein AC1031_021507 [Aphanomyces cochlioides]|nr:hypothetical protein AC1031_021507 [Aphanomyces cochlioides]
MIEAVKACDNSKNDEQAVDVLLEWGAAIKKSFISDNMQCLPISTSGAVDFVPSTKISLGDSLARFSSAQRDVAAEITELSGKLELQNRHHEQVKRELASLHHNFDQLSNHHRTALNTISAQQNTILDILSRLTDTPIQLKRRKTPSADDSTLASSVSTGVESTMDSLEPLHTRTWPNDLRSLKGWSFSSLLFRYWLDSLDETPIDGSLHAQRDARRAAAIARSILRERYPPPPGENPSETWIVVAKQQAVNVQREVLSILHAKNPQRTRTHTGAASGLIKAWRDSYLLDTQ